MTTKHQTSSLVCLLRISSLGAAIAIVHGDPKGHRRGQSRRRWWRASSRLDRLLLWYKISHLYLTLYLEYASASPEAIRTQRFEADLVCVISAERKQPPWWIRFDDLARSSNPSKNNLRMQKHTKKLFSYLIVSYLCIVLSNKGPAICHPKTLTT